MPRDRIIKIKNKQIGGKSPCFIVAEIGINHNGSLQLAKKTIDAALFSGADAVKFQNYLTEDFLENKKLDYTYRLKKRKIKKNQFEMFKKYELSYKMIIELKKYCYKRKIIFFSTPTSKSGIKLLKQLNVPILKNGSDFLTNDEIIISMARSKLPTIISTGMSKLREIEHAVKLFKKFGGKDLILLKCTSVYPAPENEINLNAMITLKKKFNCLVGLSDHSAGITASLGAVALGASIIERHFTLNKNLFGPDHKFSSDPKELKYLIKNIRQLEKNLGSNQINITKNEVKSRNLFRLSCVAADNLFTRHILKTEDIIFRRPGYGVEPRYKFQLIGRRLKRKIKKGSIIKFGDVV